MPDHDDNDPRVKDLLDAATRADLERWFGLPSFEQLAEQGITPEPPPPEDPEIAERRKRQDSALAAVDPGLLEAHRRRVEGMHDIIRPPAPIALSIERPIARFDGAMLEQHGSIAEPREVERPADLEDALAERTPQALLRDLHRPESDFYKVFERSDVMSELRVDAAAAIAEAVRTPCAPQFGGSPFREVRALLLELRDERRRPWTEIEMRQRTVTE